MKKITSAKLADLYRTKQNKDICKMLGISDPTLTKYLKQLNIPLKGKGNRKTKSRAKILIEDLD